jgi:hypothetical protein
VKQGRKAKGARRTEKNFSGISGALHLDVFEQPDHRDFFSTLIEVKWG